MNNLELFKAALGLQDPWIVTSMDFDPANHRLDLGLDFPRGSRFACPEGAITRWDNTASVAPERSTSASSIQSPPATIDCTRVITLRPDEAAPG